MAVYVACPSCETRLKVPDNMVGQGRVVKCPKCAKPFNLSAAGADPAPPKEGTDELELVQDEPRAKPGMSGRERRNDEDGDDRPRKKRPRDEDDEADEERPRGRKRRPRDDDEDEYDDRPARRRSRKAKAKSGGKLGLIIGLSVGGVVLLLGCCGVGAYVLLSGGKDGKGGGGLLGVVAAVADNPAVTDANYDKIKLGMSLQAVEDIFGQGSGCSNEDAKAVIIEPGGRGGGFGMDDRLTAIANDPKSYGLTGWYRWKNGPATLLIAVDGAKKVRVAGLFTKTANSSSRKWTSNANPAGAGPGVPPRAKGRR